MHALRLGSCGKARPHGVGTRLRTAGAALLAATAAARAGGTALSVLGGERAPLPGGGALVVDSRAIAFGLVNDPAVPKESPYSIARFETAAELRPDVRADYPGLRLTAKPRLRLTYRDLYRGVGDQSITEDDLFLNEALVRLSCRDELFLYGGRENLQWGPSYLLSPSNPFSPDNGRENPFAELPGMDYARAVWVATPAVSLSLIAQLGEGRYSPPPDAEPFSRCYAAKLDVTGEGRYAGLVGSAREGASGRPTLGGYAGVNVGEAAILYAEGGLPAQASRAQALTGGSYTFLSGGTLSAEYFYNGGGDRDSLEAPRLPQELTRAGLPAAASAMSRFRHVNYLFVQYHHSWHDVTELTARYTQGLDDGSSRLTGIVRRALNDYLTVFVTGHLECGEDGAEFGQVLRASVAAGLTAAY